MRRPMSVGTRTALAALIALLVAPATAIVQSSVPLTAGDDATRVWIDGWTELCVNIVKGSDRSVGSAGPH